MTVRPLDGDAEEDEVAEEEIEDEDGDEDWARADRVRRWMEYAGAAYGYTWFLMRQTSRRLCKMSRYVYNITIWGCRNLGRKCY